MRSVLEEHLDPVDLPSASRPLVEWLLDRAEGDGPRPGDKEETAGSSGMVSVPVDEVERAVEELDPEETWSAVAAVYRGLDGAVESGEVDADEVRVARQRVVDACRELHDALVDAELAIHREVLRDVTHDIRAPLNSIIFLTDALYEEQSGPVNEVQKRQLGIVYSAAASLLNFVNDLLDLSRGGTPAAGEVAEVTFSVEGALADARRLVAPLVDHKDTDLETEVEASGSYRGDPQVLTRVCVNLLSNAVEAADDGGEVFLRVAESDQDDLLVEVCDNGTGADLEHLRELVSSTGEEESPIRTIRGRTHGLGLLICARLVRAAGGTIEVDRDEERRTRFTVALPFHPA